MSVPSVGLKAWQWRSRGEVSVETVPTALKTDDRVQDGLPAVG